MRTELIVKSKSLGGVTDLTLLAPLKEGFVPALDAVTYKTRVKRLLRTLSMGRASTHEYALLRPFSDAVERVGKIHSVRVAVVEPEDKVLLAVSFDGAWEAYLRVLWQKVGTLLDVIFCNTKGYPSAVDTSFDEWASWVRGVQVETDFFYGIPRLTVDDVQYLRHEERDHRMNPGLPDADLGAVRGSVQSVESLAWDTARRLSPAAIAETVRLALQSLSVIHRLTSMYLPNQDDGKFLHRAARDLLLEFVRLKEETALVDDLVLLGRRRFDEPLTWLLRSPEPGRLEAPPVQLGVPPKVRNDVQAGILSVLGRNTHGALLFFAFDTAAALATFLGNLRLTRDVDPVPDDGVYRNVAFTFEGLRRAGLDEQELDWFPMEFREGMESRASVLGDFWHNHPRRWRQPLNWAQPTSPQRQEPLPLTRVELSSVHLVVQLRVDSTADVLLELSASQHPLYAEVNALAASPGALLLAVEPMARVYEQVAGQDGQTIEQVREHFGFVDGMSSPGFSAADEGDVYDNRIPLGEVLLGHPNQADAMPSANWTAAQRALMHNGTFLVVRKLRQDVAALHASLQFALDGPLKGKGLTREAVLAKMMGRRPDGKPLVTDGAKATPPFSNDFDYANDAEGRRCPFHAHIRRANPRPLVDPDVPMPPGGRFPRLIRRGMSYGPSIPNASTDDEDRGLMFMAYNASIAEQFEVVQRWLSGGNSSGGFSGQSDPFVGVAASGQQRHFRFEHGDAACAFPVDGATSAADAHRPLVRLEWGTYLFVPSISAVAKLQSGAQAVTGTAPQEPVWDPERGLRKIEALEAMAPSKSLAELVDAWKAALEDPMAQERFDCADVWAAIRSHRDGAMRTPYGVLVADADLIKQVFARSGSDFSVSGYHERMRQSIGEIYLGLDNTGPGCPYRQQSDLANTAISAISGQAAFDLAFGLSNTALEGMVEAEVDLAQKTKRDAWELNLNLKEITDPLIEGLCVAWFGLPTKQTPEFTAGPARWDWTPTQPPRCPGNFTAPSRYFFQPQPGKTVKEFGQSYGHSLTQAMTALVTRWRTEGAPAAPVAQAIFGMPGASTDLISRTMVGAMMGFIPTLDGALRLVLNEWLRDGDFWALRERWERVAVAEEAARAAGTAENTQNKANTLLQKATDTTQAALVKAMQLRPMPELVWRITAQDCQLGPLVLKRGERVVLSIASAMQQALAEGSSDVFAMFGGDRLMAPDSHACPGYAAAMGALSGALTALLRSPRPMRPSPAPLALTLGPTPPLPPLPQAPKTKEGSRAQTQIKAVASRDEKAYDKKSDETIVTYTPAESKGVLLAEGDSWFDHWSLPGLSNLLEPLAKLHKFEIDEVATAGDTLKAISQPTQLDEVALHMRRLRGRGITPYAILLSAGGNDVVARTPNGLAVLDGLLNKRADGVTEALNKDEATKFIHVQLARMLRTVLRRLDIERRRYFDKPPPIVMHGYDHPIPDGRGALGELGNWLLPSFDRQGWGEAKLGEAKWADTRRQAMVELIDMLNDMQLKVTQEAEFQGVAWQVNLCGELKKAFSTDHTLGWANELHPTAAGYVVLAEKLNQALVGIVEKVAVQAGVTQ